MVASSWRMPVHAHLVSPPREHCRWAWGAPGTGFTRSIGDTMAETIGVNAVPEVMQHSITGKDRAFIVCSDGITEHLSSQEVVDILAEHQDDLLAGAELLAAKAKDLWLDSDTYTDDITVIVVKLVQAEG